MSIQGIKLKAIADAIREKDGTTEPIVANDFPERIRAIQTGGILPENVRSISLTAEPANGGTVSGGGVASDGMTVTVNAEPDEEKNFVFDGWTENGIIVGSKELYTFLVSADRNLIAVFSEVQYVAGVDWWESLLPSSTDWYSVTFGNGKFVAVTLGDKAAYSTDGINWTAANLPTTAYWHSVTCGNGKFVAVARGTNKMAYSSAKGEGK